MNSIRKVSSVAALVTAFLALGVRASQAASFTINFCPGDGSCPANVTQARLIFTEDLGTPDANDYILDLKIVGGAGDPTYIDQLSFTINAADNVTGAGGYEVKPSLISAPGGVGNWSVFYDNVNNGGGCSADTHNGKEVCAQSGAALNGGNGVLTNGTNIWSFSVDLADDVAALGPGSVVNLRAAFLNADGSNGGIMSPNGGPLTLCRDARCDDHTTDAPEPTTLALLGTGLFCAIRARNRARQN